MSTDQNYYATAEECAAVTRQATADENWLANQLDRIDPHRHEIGSAGDRPALERLVFELKADVERLRKDAERYRWLRDVPNLYRDHPEIYRAIVEGFTSKEIEDSIDEAMKGTP